MLPWHQEGGGGLFGSRRQEQICVVRGAAVKITLRVSPRLVDDQRCIWRLYYVSLIMIATAFMASYPRFSTLQCLRWKLICKMIINISFTKFIVVESSAFSGIKEMSKLFHQFRISDSSNSEHIHVQGLDRIM